MPCGGVLREALKFDAVAALILYDEPNPEGNARNLADVDTAKPSSGEGVFWRFFDWIVKSSFEVCTDAFNTFRVSLLIGDLSKVDQVELQYVLTLAINIGNPRPPQRNDSYLP
jgi:hypothetical protein